MELDPQKAQELAKDYIGTAEPLTRLGWGISGFVFFLPQRMSAIKIHRRSDSFETEVAVYGILRKLRLTTLNGFTIPKMRAVEGGIHLIEMDFVRPPYLLDFAGVLFEPPDYSDETMALWREDIEFRFGPNAWLAFSIYDALAKHGLYYMDLRPSNLNVSNHPSAEVESSDDID